MAHKNYIIDTSVLIHAPNCVEVFEDNTVIIPIAVLEELDHLKGRPDNVGTNARLSIRKIDEYCNDKDICGGIELKNNIKLIIDVDHVKDNKFNGVGKDDSILACASCYKDSILVSKDINMRLRAKAHGIKAQDYLNDKVEVEELYTGYRKIDINSIDENILTKINLGLESVLGTPFEQLYPNEFAILDCNGKEMIFRRHPNDSLKPLKIPPETYGLKSKNKEQAMALDLLLDPNVSLVALYGPAGTGKTIISVSAALHQCIDTHQYKKVEFYKSISSVGESLGFLPGDLFEKLQPHYGSIIGCIEALNPSTSFEEFLDLYKNKVKIEAISLLRGKTINGFAFFDEVQNNSKNEIKTIITRAGHNSKIVLSGDIYQIDASYLNAENNALTHVIETFKLSKLSGTVKLIKGERSPLATEASQIL